MFVIGLTGGIGAGKSEAGNILRELGAVVIDADKVAHLSYLPCTEAYEQLVALFGTGILDDSGVVDRTKLGSIIFDDDVARKALESIVWPATRLWIENRLKGEEDRDTNIVVLEVPKLFESGWDDIADVVWTIEVSTINAITRVQKRTGLSPWEVESRIDAQMSNEQRSELAGLTINNDGDIGALRSRIHEAWKSLPVNRE